MAVSLVKRIRTSYTTFNKLGHDNKRGFIDVGHNNVQEVGVTLPNPVTVSFFAAEYSNESSSALFYLTPEQARQIGTELLRRANEAETYNHSI